jgi:hypothetical protein
MLAPLPGLLKHEFFMLGPFHVGFQQYWMDLKSLQDFTHSQQHAGWRACRWPAHAIRLFKKERRSLPNGGFLR